MSAVGYALLWDFDGTLVDSGELWRRSEYTFLNARKLPWNDAASRRLLGGNLELAAHVMAEVTGVRFSVDELRRGLGDAVRDALSRHVPWMPGVRGLLREQHQRGLRSALVTSSYAAIVRTALEQLAYAPFQSWVTREDVERPKPDPQLLPAGAGAPGYRRRRGAGYRGFARRRGFCVGGGLPCSGGRAGSARTGSGS